MSPVSCHKCNKALSFLEPEEKISRQEECPGCHTSLHCCKMCVFYDLMAYNDCREDNAERVVDKEKANFCDYFVLAGERKIVDQAAILSAAEALFRK